MTVMSSCCGEPSQKRRTVSSIVRRIVGTRPLEIPVGEHDEHVALVERQVVRRSILFAGADAQGKTVAVEARHGLIEQGDDERD